MADGTSPFNFDAETLAQLMARATATGDGTFADIFEVEKEDLPGSQANDTDVKFFGGRRWSNPVDNFVQDIYSRHSKTGKFWVKASLAAMQALGLDDDEIAVGQLGWSILEEKLYRIVTLDTATTSTWAEVSMGGAPTYSRYAVDSKVKGAYGFEWIPGSMTTDLTDRSAEGNDLTSLTGQATYGRIGNLTGVNLETVTANIQGPIGPSNLPTTGDMLVELILSWKGAGNLGADIILFHNSPGGDLEIDNAQWGFGNETTTGVGLRSFHENGAGLNNILNFLKLEPPNDPYTLAYRRIASTKTVEFYFMGVFAGSMVYANAPTGGANAHLEFGHNGLTECTIADCVISNESRTPSEILSRAQDTGVAP